MNKILIAYLCILFMVMACSREKPQDKYKFIEYLRVEGSCFENHSTESAFYSGALVHWYNVTKKKHVRYGAVNKSEHLNTKEIIEEIKHPHKYYPPFTIEFSNIPADAFGKTEMSLEGISQHLPKGNAEEGPSYEATCELKVIERLGYNPNSQKGDIGKETHASSKPR